MTAFLQFHPVPRMQKIPAASDFSDKSRSWYFTVASQESGISRCYPLINKWLSEKWIAMCRSTVISRDGSFLRHGTFVCLLGG